MPSLFALALAACLGVLPNGKTAARFPRVESVAADLDDVGKRTGVARERLGALLIGENDSFAINRVSWTGSSTGLMQFRKGGPYHRAARTACRAVPSQCQWVHVLIAARVLGEALEACDGRFACAVAAYRFGHLVEPRDVDLKVVETAERLWALGGAQ